MTILIWLLFRKHTANQKNNYKKGKIPGCDLLGATYHQAYGVATYVRHNIKNASLISTSTENGIHVVVTKIGGTTVSNIYKPPATA